MHPVLLSGSPILDVDATLLIYLGVFAALLFILNALVFKPMMALFDAREEAIDGAKREARNLEKRAEEKLKAFEHEMEKVRKEVGVERDRMKAEALATEREVLDQVRAETAKIRSAADIRINAEAAKVRKDIGGKTPSLAREIATKLLGREVRS